MKNLKQKRLNKILNPKDRRTVILPLDHGISDGPIAGLIDMRNTLKKAIEGGVDTIIIHKGIYKIYRDLLIKKPVMIHISASTMFGEPLRKVIVTRPSEVIALGAIGVSIHINLANEFEHEMIRDLGIISGECEELGLPLLAMIYPRNRINNKIVTFTDVEHVKHAARLGAELGADIVKVPYTGDSKSFSEVVRGCPIPVVIAGGAKGDEKTMLKSIDDCIKVGAAGVSVGRNVFQHEDMVGMIKKVRKIVHQP
ncbi:fructose-bisphosphate aldolase [Candidatus Roizmanbacteria bacterium CG02_land_8_20_14_3_00_36_15]|uniref:Fructose-bisphosphate aldolase n=2 Tax=Candidatus Roizmaniibacteriota TaxID=1752723 RepID=A0A2M8KLD3_9BACT|nr:MAG: fructose-bisphosphate aldolase [Candidatus Roizmanbacteria bacterium CG03_land_8_20_14_0_80_36_21]PIV38046.1 MAG: fructose-bisphosphate aldolase [Candidatus Roizmanbacteria bacterium CG02_land_8_20_14_3_00_36_15]PIY70219.1 MAG: fructose-bisphosphate aldolase [Candidatus Roizmanbacteria bacterium CG_4_10_14_0_8_um_filter_36_36]PJA52946.1 MAG: fructose-bisphosphate aldolase [Candidatus Roizmanbacteria bacterium CG_4_9_14_3_um_filter_36_11]PJC81275.1 MAG: fructose-bisphosphate aldolase [Ca